MHFDLNDDQREIRVTAKSLLTSRSPMSAVRAAAETSTYDPALWREITELGWPGIAVSEDHGGGGLGLVELVILLEESGYALAGAPLLASTSAALVIEAAGDDRQREEWLPRLACGAARAALGRTARNGVTLVPDGAGADVIVVLDANASNADLLTPASADILPSDTVDPTRRYAMVEGDGAALNGDVAFGAHRAMVALSAELVGVCQRALDMTVEYVKQRKQFGVPVGSFQGVAHKCADMLLATEGARGAVYFAAWAAGADAGRLASAASVAKVAASDAGREVTASAIQGHGGIGFTWEADVHWLYKRSLVDAVLLGGASEHRARMARVMAEESPVAAHG
jgi:alkylation response protein AidB-like acyl-CoA dehydrogenase